MKMKMKVGMGMGMERCGEKRDDCVRASPVLCIEYEDGMGQDERGGERRGVERVGKTNPCVRGFSSGRCVSLSLSLSPVVERG